MEHFAQSTLSAFSVRHPETTASLNAWSMMVKKANWKNMQELQRAMATAKVLNGDRARLEVAGGNYRLVAAFKFKSGVCFVKFLGTHADYDRVDALTVSMF